MKLHKQSDVKKWDFVTCCHCGESLLLEPTVNQVVTWHNNVTEDYTDCPSCNNGMVFERQFVYISQPF